MADCDGLATLVAKGRRVPRMPEVIATDELERLLTPAVMEPSH